MAKKRSSKAPTQPLSKPSQVPANQSTGPYAATIYPGVIRQQELTKDDITTVNTVNQRLREMVANRHTQEQLWDDHTNAFLMTPQLGKEDWQAKGQSSLLFGVVEGILAEILDSEPTAQMVSMVDEVDDITLRQLDRLVHIPLKERQNYTNQILIYKDAFIGGTGIGKVGYACEERAYDFLIETGTGADGNPTYKYKKEVVSVRENIEIRRVAPNRFLFDPYATSIEDSEDCIELIWYGYDQFLRTYENQEFYHDLDVVKPMMRVGTTPSYGAGSTEPLLQRFLIPGVKQYVRVIEYWNKTTDTFAVIANGILIRQTPIPYNDKRLPYFNYRFGIVPDRLYAQGLGDILQSSQTHLSANLRLGIDQGKLASTPPIIYSTQLGLDDDQIGQMRPGRGLSVEGDVGQTKVLQVADLSNSLFRMNEILHEEARMASGFDTRLMQGQSGATTAFEYGIRKESQMKRIAMSVKHMEIDGTVPLLERVWSRMQQFYTSEKVYRGFDVKNGKSVKVIGYPSLLYQDNATGGDWKKIAITKELAAEMQKDLRPVIRSGTQVGKSKMMERAAAMEEFNLLGKTLTDPTTAPGQDPRIVSLKRLVEHTVNRLGFDYEKIKPEGPWTPPPPPPPDPTTKENISIRGDIAKMPPEIQEKVMEKVLGQQLSPQPFQGMPQGGMPPGQPPTDMAQQEVPAPLSAPPPLTSGQANASQVGSSLHAQIPGSPG